VWARKLVVVGRSGRVKGTPTCDGEDCWDYSHIGCWGGGGVGQLKSGRSLSPLKLAFGVQQGFLLVGPMAPGMVQYFLLFFLLWVCAMCICASYVSFISLKVFVLLLHLCIQE
jgi:hypothetical protein